MIYFIDNFLDKSLFDTTWGILNNNTYVEHVTPGKSFWVQEADPAFVQQVLSLLEKKENKKLHCILGFFRLSTDVIDAEWRIHSDGIINGVQPQRAAVLYFSPTKFHNLHGTAFWSHHYYGKNQPDSIDATEFDRLLLEDSGDLNKWNLDTVVGYNQNRIISYPANYFHSRYPNKSWDTGRQVFVMFYKEKE
tara:strand:+ start:835 stop:1410 length:576 start_codon:yes stop_codon:yes gene_type:complete